jgi:3-oxoacyl-[acyl-carrier protein] reductase
MAGTLVGEVAIVTGAGRGIGRTIAEWLAAEGADLVLVSRTASEVDELASRLAADHGIRVLGRAVDVARPDDLATAVDTAVTVLGPASVAIANAAILGPVGVLADTDPARWTQTLDVNVGGTANVVRCVLPSMVERGHGRIVTLSGGGVGGPRPAERVSAYVASKAAVVALTEVVARELPTGVTINAVAPGAVPTTFMQEVVELGAEVAGEALHATAAGRDEPDLEPLRRLLLYLVAGDSTHVSGCCLSARWDDPARLTELGPAIGASSRFRMRRIDEDLYREAAEVGA